MRRALQLIFASALLLSAQKRPVTLADYYQIEGVSSPALSPDGKQVAYVRTRINQEENRRVSEVWLAAVDGLKEPRRASPAGVSANNPLWSPDGKLLGYASAGKYYFIAEGKEPMQIPGLGGAPIFSPNGQWVAFTMKTPPTGTRPATAQSDFDKLTQQRFRGRIYDWMNFRFDGRGYLPDPRDPFATPPSELYVMPLNGEEPRQITTLGVDVHGAAWRPDSKALAFTANMTQRDENQYERADLFTVTVGGTLTRLTDDGNNYSAPSWHPGGILITFLGEQSLNVTLKRKQRIGSPLDVYLISPDGRNLKNMTFDWDYLPANPQFSGDGGRVYFSAAVRGTAHLFFKALPESEVRQVTKGNRLLSDFDVDFANERIAYVSTDLDTPPEVHVMPLHQADSARAITKHNAALLGQWKLGQTERIGFDSKDGTPIDGWVTLPPNYDPARGPYPLILNIHGGPHGAYSNSFSFANQLQAAEGYIVLCTNPRASTGYGEKFRWGTWGAWGDKDMEDVMSGIDYALKNYAADPQRLGVTGYSYGGFLTNWIVGHTNRFRAAITGAGPTNWISNYGTGDIPRTKESEFLGYPWEADGNATMIKYSPITYVAKMQTPVLFVHGESDVRVPISQAEELYTALKKRKIPAKFIRYPNSYHGGWSAWDTVHRYQQEMLWWKEYLRP